MSKTVYFSFEGCIEDLRVNHVHIDLQTASLSPLGNDPAPAAPGCTKEETCHPSPCHQRGECSTHWGGYQCHCHSPYMGTNCSQSGFN